jgi:hypothetical protein
MGRVIQGWSCVGLVAVAMLLPGSRMVSAEDKKTDSKPTTKKEEHHHADKGPHGGALIELGEEEYHGEIVMEDKTHSVIIYLLGSNAKDPVAVEAPEVFINLKHGSKPLQFKLKASPTKTDPKGKASRFVLKDHDLMHDLGHDNAQARLRVKIAGKSYSGEIEATDHHHDHAEHPAPEKKKS